MVMMMMMLLNECSKRHSTTEGSDELCRCRHISTESRKVNDVKCINKRSKKKKGEQKSEIPMLFEKMEIDSIDDHIE